MKWLFIVAALLNIGFFSYNSFFDDKSVNQKKVVKKSGKNQIVLLSELDAGKLKQLQNKTIPIQATPVNLPVDEQETTQILASEQLTLSNQKYCAKLGPFNKNEMDEIKLILENEYQNKLSFGIETTSATTYYRIYIPPVESKETRDNTLAKLDEHGMKDHYVMSINGRKNAIALGVFKKYSAAETIATKASKIGLSTTIEAISDDKDSLYKLQLVFQENTDISFYNMLISEKQLKSTECEK